MCQLPDVIFVHKHVLGASREGPYHHAVQGNVYDRLDLLVTFMTAKQLPPPTIVVINSIWWDVAHYRLAAAHGSLLKMDMVQNYYQNLTKLVLAISKQFNISQQQVVLQTAVLSATQDILQRSAAS